MDLLIDRTNRGKSQVQMAALIGVTRRVYQAAESGTRVPSGENALKFAAFYSKPVSEIFPPRPPIPQEVAA